MLETTPVDLPRAVRLEPQVNQRPSTKRILGTSVEELLEAVNSRAVFGRWEIDAVLGFRKADNPSILTLVDRLTAYLAGKRAEVSTNLSKNFVGTNQSQLIMVPNLLLLANWTV